MNNFNPSDTDDTGHFKIKTILNDIAKIKELGLFTDGKIKRCESKSKSYFKYNIRLECGHSSYRQISKIKNLKQFKCSKCAKELNYKNILDSKHNYHKSKIRFYESFLISGSKVLDVIRNRDGNKKPFYTIEFKCACGEISHTRPGDIEAYKRKNKRRNRKAGIGCSSCGAYVGMDYGDYSPIKTMLKQIKKELQ